MTTQARELAGIISNAGDLSFIDDVTLKSDSAVLNFGADSDVTLTHVADTALLLNSTRQLQFGDSGTYIYQSADGVLDLVSDTEIELNATTLDINANVDISGTLTVAGALDFGDLDISNVGSIALDTITNDGTDLTLDSSGDIIFDADGKDIILKDGGTEFGRLKTSSTPDHFYIKSAISNNDLIFQGNDGGSSITALTLDMSEAGAATFNSTVTASGFVGNVTGNASGTAATVTTAAQTNITSLGTLTTLTVDNVLINGTTIGHTSDTDLLTLADGALTVAGTIGSGVITCDGLITGNNEDVSIGGVLKGSDSTFQILTSTSDGSDSSRIRMNGGGGTGDSRGAQLELQGNEHTFVGDAILSAGNATAAYVALSAPNASGYITYSTAGSERFRIASSGQLGIAGANYGTDGQILTSTGASTAPAWEDAAEGGISTGKAIAMAMVFG